MKMIVKIKNKHLYDLYLNAKRTVKIDNCYGFDKKIYFVDCFLKSLDVNTDCEVKKVIDAILDDKDVELKKTRYRVPLPHMTTINEWGNPEPVFLCKIDSVWAISQSGARRTEFTMDEIPEEYHQWAEKVKD